MKRIAVTAGIGIALAASAAILGAAHVGQAQAAPKPADCHTAQTATWTFTNTLGTPLAVVDTPTSLGFRHLQIGQSVTFTGNVTEFFTYREDDGKGDWGQATISRTTPACSHITVAP